jgi:LysM repeat protein
MAPLALLVALAAVGYVVSSTTSDGEGTGAGGSSSGTEERERSGTSTQRSSTTPARTTPAAAEPKTYTVKAGDTLGVIAEQTGVPVVQLIELNPDVDPQSLTVGEQIRLRR